MYDRELTEQLLILHEGERLKPYRCTAGKLTIGVGRNLDDNGITRAESRHLLANDIKQAVLDARKFYPYFEELAPARQTVLIDMAFNLGLSRLRKFKAFPAAMARGDWESAEKHMLDSAWAGQVGKRARRLATMMRTGRYPAEPIL